MKGRFVGVIALVLLTNSCGDGSTGSSSSGAGTSSGSVLFAFDAKSGTSTADRLTLSGLHTHVLQFSDSPRRVAERLTPESFFASWDEIFPTSSPNAVLAYETPTGDRLAAVELDNPVYDVTTGEVSFDYFVLNGAAPLLPVYSNVSVFVDDGETTCSFTASGQLLVDGTEVDASISATISNLEADGVTCADLEDVIKSAISGAASGDTSALSTWTCQGTPTADVTDDEGTLSLVGTCTSTLGYTFDMTATATYSCKNVACPTST